MGLSTLFRLRYALLLGMASVALPTGAHAQHVTELPAARADAVRVAELPDAPQPARAKAAAAEPEPAVVETVALRRRPVGKYRLVVRSDEVVAPLSGTDKLKLSVLSRLSPMDVGETVFSAGWSHVNDSSPHYGTDKGAFGERLGALALKQTTQSVFTYGLYAAALHDDPRYYVMGPEESVKRRAVYSATRLLVARTDSGRDAINWPKLAGIASATALSGLYYPKQDRGLADQLTSFGMSLATSVLTNELHEFMGDAFRAVRGNR